MYIINLYKNKRLWIVILFAIFVAITLIVITFSSVFTISDEIVKNSKEDFMDLKSYYTEYELNVYSNKNQNKYFMKEWYMEKSNEEYNFKIETNNDGTNFSYILANNSLSVKSDNQLNYMKLNDYIIDRKNVASISTFIDIFRKINTAENIEKKEDCCKMKIEEEDNKICYSIMLNNNSDKNCSICSDYKEITYSGMKISSFELLLDKENLQPLEYTVDGKTWADIIFTKFDINADFDEKIFAFS